MGKHKQRTSRGSGKNKQKKHTRTLWTCVEREVRRKELDETARVSGTTVAEIAKAQKAEAAKNENKTDKTTQGVTEVLSQHGNSASSSTDHGGK